MDFGFGSFGSVLVITDGTELPRLCTWPVAGDVAVDRRRALAGGDEGGRPGAGHWWQRAAGRCASAVRSVDGTEGEGEGTMGGSCRVSR